MTERTREHIWGNGETVRGSQDEGRLRYGYKVFVIGQWSFVSGHLNEKCKMTNEFFSLLRSTQLPAAARPLTIRLA